MEHIHGPKNEGNADSKFYPTKSEFIDDFDSIKDLIDSKLDKTGKAADSAKADYATSAGSATTASNAANAAHADTADTATSAGKATNDGNGNNIAQTYAKLSDIPSSVDAYSKTESDNRYFQKSASLKLTVTFHSRS